MAIRIGVDPDWYGQQDLLRQRSLAMLVSAIQDKQDERKRDAQLALQMLSAYPDPTAISEFEKEYGDNSAMRMAAEQLKRQSDVTGRFFEGIHQGQSAYESRRADADAYAKQDQPMSSSNWQQALYSLASQADAHAQEEAARRDVLTMDPSGISQSFAGLDPAAQAFIASRAHDWGMEERLTPAGYKDWTNPLGASFNLVRSGMESPEELQRTVSVAAGMAPSPRTLAEQESAAKVKQADEVASQKRTQENYSYQDKLIRGRMALQDKYRDTIVNPETGELSPKPVSGSGASDKQDTSAIKSEILTAMPDPQPVPDFALGSQADNIKLQNKTDAVKNDQFASAASVLIQKINAKNPGALPPGEVTALILEAQKNKIPAEKIRAIILAKLNEYLSR